MKTTFVHAGDLFLDAPVSGLSTPPTPIAAALRDATLDAFDALVRVTIEHGASFLVVSGRLAPAHGLSLRAQVRLRDGLERLREKEIAVYLLEGVERPEHDWSGMRSWPDRVTVFGPGGGRAVAAERGSAREVFVHGLSEPNGPPRENPAHGFVRDPATGFHIGVIRSPATWRDGAWASLSSLETLQTVGLDYWALGLDTDGPASRPHAPCTLSEDAPRVVYPGAIQELCADAPSRGGSPSVGRGAMVVRVKDNAVKRAELVEVDRVRFITVDTRPASRRDQDFCPRRALAEELDRLRGAHGDRVLIVRGVLPKTRLPLPDLLRELRSESEHLRPHVWWDRIEVDPFPDLDRQEFSVREDFAAEIVRRGDHYRSASPELAELFAAQDRLVEEAGIDPGLVPVSASDSASLLESAEKTALGMLEEEVEG